MTKLIEAFLVIAIALFVGALLGTAVGALSGWIVGLFYTNTIQTVLVALGFQAVQVWQLGTFFGFVGGFLRSIPTTKG